MMRRSRLLLAAATCVLPSALLCVPAMAQQASAPAAEDGDIIVTGQRGAANRARAAERDADNLVNVITSDAAGEFSDENVAESLARAPGLNVLRSEGEGRNISIRGLPPSFTQVTVNGARIGSVDGGSSDVQLDSIASDLLDTITVTKSITPDLDGDAIGGSVDLEVLSAFSRGQNSYTASAAGYYNEFLGEWGPEAGLSVTRLFNEDRIGVAAALSYSKREVGGDDLRNDAGLTPFSSLVAGLPGLRPDEIDHRVEIGTRERIGGSLNFEVKPSANSQAFLRFQYSRFADDDGRFQNEYETDQADRSDELGVVAIGRAELLARPPATRTTGGPDIDKQINFQDYVDEVYAGSVGSEHDGKDWSFNWQFDYSMAQSALPEGYRGRFRVRNVTLNTTFGEDDASVRPVAVGGRDPANPASYAFDQLLIFNYDRTDEIHSVKADVERKSTVFGKETTFKFGGKYRLRDKFFDRNQRSVNPQDFAAALGGLAGNLSTLAIFRPESGIDDLGFFPEREAARGRFQAAAQVLKPLVNPQLIESFGQDYTVDEQTSAVYGMATVTLSPALKLIGGVRVESTDLASTGYYIEADDDGVAPTGRSGLIDLGNRGSTFTEALPSLHALWRPSDRLDVRASYNRGLKLPDFDDFANRQQFNTEELELSAGNPFLEPMTADQIDLSVGWYPNRNTALQVALFHKRLENFFVEANLNYRDARNPIRVPSGSIATDANLDATEIELTVNGDEGTVTGVELAYTQNYTFLPGPLSGLFMQANLTLVESEAKLGADTFDLPDQPDTIANLSLGWENDVFSARVAGNYRGESVDGVASNAFENTFNVEYFSYDVNLRLNINDNFQVFVDAANLNEANDEVVFQGTAETGRIFQQIESFGRTFKAGVRARF